MPVFLPENYLYIDPGVLAKVVDLMIQFQSAPEGAFYEVTPRFADRKIFEYAVSFQFQFYLNKV